MIRTALLVLGVVAGWISLTIAVAYAVPPRDASDALPDLAFDPHFDLTTPPNPVPRYDRAPSVRTEVPTTAAPAPPPRPRVTQPRPPPAAVSGVAGVEQWRDEVAAYGDWDVDLMLRIMGCESGGRANADNPSSTASGLFQILGGPYDPVANIALAHSMWSTRGTQPWNSSRSCWG